MDLISDIFIGRNDILIAFSEARKELNDHAENKNVLRRSFDGGDAGAWRSHANQNFKPNIHEVYSDDLGVSWNLGQSASNQSPGMPNEVQMVELNDGTIMLNARSYKGNHCRKIACSQDEGKTWSLSQTLVKGSFAYSCLVKLSDNEFGILFERDNYSKISFSRKRIDWLLS